MKEYISDFAAGNPKHIQELVDQLVDKGAINFEGGKVHVLVDTFEHVSDYRGEKKRKKERKKEKESKEGRKEGRKKKSLEKGS